ncbi:MAG: hypothetical protein RR388_01580 [Rikenellaceae bacterium]
MGIRKRILLGFTSLGFLLFIAGVISYFELARLNESTLKTVDKGASGIIVAKDILDLIEEQDVLILQIIQNDSINYLPRNNVILSRIDTLSHRLSNDFVENGKLKRVISEKSIYVHEVEKMIADTSNIAKLAKIQWYFAKYKPAYRNFAHSTKNFMVQTQENVVNQTKHIKNSAYRATMQGIIALAAAVVLIIIFFFMIDTYFIKPVTKMTSALKDYLTHKTPFDITIEGKDEVYKLKTYIKQLINTIKSQQPKQ